MFTAPLFTRALAGVRLQSVRLLRAPLTMAALGDSAPMTGQWGRGGPWRGSPAAQTLHQRRVKNEGGISYPLNHASAVEAAEENKCDTDLAVPLTHRHTPVMHSSQRET